MEEEENANHQAIKVVLQWQEEPVFGNYQVGSGIELSDAAK